MKDRSQHQQMRDAINDVELALNGLEIDSVARRWEGAHDSVMVKLSEAPEFSYPDLAAAHMQKKYNDALGYATRLAQYLWETHWKDTAPDWKPLPDLMGVLTQIDNAVANLKKPA